MSNYAIILGVDKYKYASALPSCENDANLMEGLLTATGKYKVLRIANNAAKHQIQEEISSFLPLDSTDIFSSHTNRGCKFASPYNIFHFIQKGRQNH